MNRSMPLSDMQKMILMSSLMQPQEENYAEQITIKLVGIDINKAREIWSRIYQRHPMLSACIRWKGRTEPIIEILNGSDSIHIYSHPKEAKLNPHKINIEKNSFCVSLIKQDDSAILLILDFHHIFFDGWSISLLLHEFMDSCYGKPYKEFNEYHAHFMYLNYMSENRTNGLLYWKRYLSSFTWPVGNVKPKKNIPEIRQKDFPVPAMLYEQILRVSHSHFVTPAACLYYLWAKALHVFFPDDPVVFGVTVSGRNIGIVHIDKLVGMFIHTVPFIINPETLALPCFESINKIMMDIHCHQEKIPSYYGFMRNPSHFHGQMNSVVTIQNYPAGFSDGNNISFSLVERRYHNQVPLLWSVRFIDKQSYFDFSFDSKIYSEELIDKLFFYIVQEIQALSE